MTEHRVVTGGKGATLGGTLGLARPALWRLLLASLLGACAIGATVLLMATSAWMLSRASQRPGEAALGLSIVAVQFFGLSRGFFRYGERLVGHDAAFRLLANLRVRFYRHIEELAPAGLPAFSRGDLLARMVGDVDSLQDLLLRVIPPYATALLVGIGTVAGMWWILPAAGATTLVALLLAATAVPWLTGRLARRAARREALLKGALTNSFVDLIEGAAELTVFGATAAEVERVTQLDASLTRISASNASTTGSGLGLTTLLAGLAATGSLYFGARAVHTGHLSGLLLGTLAVVPLAAFELVSPLPAATQALARARQCAARIFAVLDTPAPVTDPAHPIELRGGPHRLEARAVWASYPTSASPVLRGIDLDLSPGRFVAVVGRSGAGKSTLAAVLLDFLTPDAGTVLMDGVALERCNSDEVRSIVGMVDQLPHLFDASLAANLRLARPSATDGDLADALDRVGLGPFLGGLPDGLDTEVGRSGSRLSGGQRQRIGIARALLADWPILILDEPTEHLDQHSADQVMHALFEDASDRSTLLITHRLSGLEVADEILVVENGTVIERGTHAALLHRAGLYAAWWWEERSTQSIADRTPRTAAPEAAGIGSRPTQLHQGRDAQ